MVDRASLLESIPHYLAMLVVIFLVLIVLRGFVGNLGFWVELVVVIVVASLYAPVVRRLGIAPSSWEKR